MRIVLTIECDNAAFAEDPGVEVVRILREAAEVVRFNPLRRIDGVPLRDINGNTVARFTVEGWK